MAGSTSPLIRGLSPISFLIVILFGSAVPCWAQSFVNWESPQIHPLEMTPDGLRLLAVNTPDNRLEVFDLATGSPFHVGSVPVGLDPVTVRARTNDEAWVVNHISDSISIVHLPTFRVKQTITTGDEPTDVVFAGSPQRAFVCLSQLNHIKVYDPADLDAPPVVVPIQGEDPRSLATDGTRVFAAIFESGNRSTILSEFEVSDLASPYAGQNPPPNAGTLFDPPIAVGLPTPPASSMIVKKNAAGMWMDDNNHDWSAFVTWDMHDHDLAVIDANTLAVTYATGMMNLCMSVAVHPSGKATVVGTDGMNEVRFEPKLRGTFLRVRMAEFDPDAPAPPTLHDLNPHLTYAAASIPAAQREQAVGDPRGIVWQADGLRGFVTGMGSNNVVAIDAAGARVGRVDVGEGPTGLVLDEPRQSLYVLNRFDDSISVVDLNSLAEMQQVAMFDPTPAAIHTGRPHLYDTHQNSGLGHVSCASCHPDARMDQIAWDLGDPNGAMKARNQTCTQFPVFGPCDDWHPMKGALVTQTLVGLGTSPPLHWRGDRANLSEFNPTFVDLQARDAQLTTQQMNDFLAFINTIRMPPNPNRNFDGSLRESLGLGNPLAGSSRFNRCSTCHFPGQGFNNQVVTEAFRGDSQSFNTAHLRNLYEKTGFDKTRMDNNRGFGFLHDGHADTLITLMEHPVFGPGAPSATFSAGAAGDQERLDVEAFMLSEFPTPGSTPPCIGVQTTLIDAGTADPGQLDLIDDMMAMIDSTQFPIVGLIVKGMQAAEARGYYYLGDGVFQSDRMDETIAAAPLLAAAMPGSELTYMMVTLDARIRMGVDRDQDSHFDRDELDNCSDPENALSTPTLRGDVLVDGEVDVADIEPFVEVLVDPAGSSFNEMRADMNCDGLADGRDLQQFVDRLLS